MALSKAQQTLVAKVKAVGNSGMAVPIDDDVCAYLLSVIVCDLGLEASFPELSPTPPPFFRTIPAGTLRVEGVDFFALFERLLNLREDADTYFACLATLHKARLKYERILQAQPIPTIDQVGPRGLLQYGSLSPGALAAFLFWRKWIFDIDNRSGQETGYLFEPIIAGAIGGIPVSAKRSPVKRHGNGTGRQVDCIRAVGKEAYEIKLRVTIAASGQGRWQEELDFPRDCEASGYRPVLVVLDPTPNPKLAELREAFTQVGGDAHIGLDAWKHLESLAGATMATFLEAYVHKPISALLRDAPDFLPDIRFSMRDDQFAVEVMGEKLILPRQVQVDLASPDDEIPEDLDETEPD